MCGLAGWVSFDRDLTNARDVLDAMTATMSCRGPDDEGTALAPHAALGHRRLAVIDLPGGRQPMTASTPAGDVTLVYIGETYNFRELRRDLEAAGRRFATDSDTEVVLNGYLQWGEGIADRLNGMYGFAIWDGRTSRLLLVRDRLGVKPLYYYPTADGVLVGSEPKAILANPLARAAVDTDGLRDLIAVTRAPEWALWKGMREVSPGTLVHVDRAGIRSRRYWQLSTYAHTDDRDTTVARVRDLMTDITQRQLVADVPRCVLLSGGLDSSALTGLAAAHLRKTGQRVRTFSVDFAGHQSRFQPDPLRDTVDAPYIQDVAALADTDHHAAVLDSAQLSDPAVRRTVIAARDMPSLLGDLEPSLYLLSRAIKAESTVALSGEAADEIFGGYRWFHDDTARRADTFPWRAFPGSLTADRHEVFRPDVRDLLAIEDYTADQYATAAAAIEHPPGETGLEHRMRTVCHLNLTRLLRTVLDRKDRMSMAVGLEIRVPYCDHRLVDYVYNTPWSLKTFDGHEKSLLRHATAHVLPESVAARRKNPYPSTQDPHYAAALQQQAKEILAEPAHRVFDLVDHAWLADAVALDPDRVPRRTRAGLDQILDLHQWLEMYNPELHLDR